MAAMNEQVKPLAPTGYHLRSDVEDEDEAMSKHFKLRRRRYLQCCGCLTVLLLIPVVIIIVVITMFEIKNPSIKMNSLRIQHIVIINGGTFRANQENMTLLADVSVKNPNLASFRFGNTTASIYYGGVVVGEGRIPAGMVKARRTLRMNVTVDIVPEKMSSVPSLKNDLSSGVLNMSSYGRISGRVKVLKFIKKSIVVKMDCTIVYNISSQAIQSDCRRHGHL